LIRNGGDGKIKANYTHVVHWVFGDVIIREAFEGFF
jgi:hypothetical protein